MLSPSLVSFDDIKPVEPITGWQEFLEEGEAYLKTCSGALSKGRKIFTPEILYNIIAMGIEKLVMATLMKQGALPYNHTMFDLVEAMDDVFPHSLDSIRAELLDFDKYQEICDVDHFKIIPPEPEKVPEMLAVAFELQHVVYGQISGVSP